MNIEVNRSAKAYSKATISIEASVVVVFKIISEINNWSRWQTGVAKANIEGEPIKGKSFVWKTGGVNIVSTLHTVDPFTEIGWTGKFLWITAVHNWYLRDEKNGNCQVTVEESLSGFLSGVMKRSLHEGMIKNLQELKIAAEMH
jgi:hypothetical protein